MKKKLRGIVLCVLLLAFFTYCNYVRVKTVYVTQSSSNSYREDFEYKLKEENKAALESESEYQKLLNSQEGGSVSLSVPAKKELKMHSKAALLMDAENNRVLYELNGYDRLPMASTTKIMTCIIALEQGDLNEVVTISSYAARQPDVQLNARTGEQYYLKDLLYSLMLESHNDVAVAIAEHIGGSVEGFSAIMNDKARELGCENTNFVTPNGLDAEGHYTTAKELAIITSYALQNKEFIDITNTPAHQFQELINKRSFSVTNKNRFLYMMDGAIGVKTGFTNKAGYCFVGAIRKSDRTLISVVLGCGWPPSKTLKWTDSTTLMNYGIQGFDKKQIFRDVYLEPIPVERGKEKWVNLKLEGDMNILLGEQELVDIEYDIPISLKAPVAENAVAGYAKYYINGEIYKEIPISVQSGVEEIDLKYCFTRMFSLWAVDK